MSQVVPFLDAVEREWKTLALGLPSSVETQDVRLDGEHRTLCVELKWPGHVASITAWEHATCLDVDVLELNSKKGLILAAGPCDGQSDASARLLKFRDYIHASLTTS